MESEHAELILGCAGVRQYGHLKSSVGVLVIQQLQVALGPCMVLTYLVINQLYAGAGPRIEDSDEHIIRNAGLFMYMVSALCFGGGLYGMFMLAGSVNRVGQFKESVLTLMDYAGCVEVCGHNQCLN